MEAASDIDMKFPSHREAETETEREGKAITLIAYYAFD